MFPEMSRGTFGEHRRLIVARALQFISIQRRHSRSISTEQSNSNQNNMTYCTCLFPERFHKPPVEYLYFR